MKRIGLLFILICASQLLFSQSPVTITKPSTIDYKCGYGNLRIKGYSNDTVFVSSSCHYKGKTVAFDLKTFNYLKDCDKKEWFNDHGPVRYTLTNLTTFGSEYRTITSKEESPWKADEYFKIDYGYRGVTYVNSQGYGGNSIVFMGIAISKLDTTGKIYWSHTFPRAPYMIRADFGPEFGRPLFITKNNMIYLIYSDVSRNFDTKTIEEIPSTFVEAKRDLVCIKIDPVQGSFEKYLITSYSPVGNGYFTNQCVALGDGIFAVLGWYKNNGNYTFYKLSVE